MKSPTKHIRDPFLRARVLHRRDGHCQGKSYQVANLSRGPRLGFGAGVRASFSEFLPQKGSNCV